MGTVPGNSPGCTIHPQQSPDAESVELAPLGADTPPEPKCEYAVTVRNAFMQYSDMLSSLSSKRPATLPVLRNCNMSVEKGHIYGLLGSSGCGKTTLLRAIVGEHKLKAGKISVLGNEPRAPGSSVPGTLIGYMPQGLSLLDELTISENLRFYGLIGGMNDEEIKAKTDYYVRLLDLPHKDRIASSLSGGQQRRVSFVIALFHSPPILVLDEPTVGVDPLLREKIWKHIMKLARRDGTSVIISTHYIEEASSADTVGFLRHGELIAEQSPQSLMQILQTSDLEEALLKLCLRHLPHDQSSDADLPVPAEITPVKHEEVTIASGAATHRKIHISSSRKIRALAWKNGVTMLRQPWVVLFICLLPAFLVAIGCSSIGGDPKGVYISVFNQETDCSLLQNFISNEDNNSRALYQNCNMPSYFSCSMLKLLDSKEILSVNFQTEESAKEYVRMGKSWGVVIFPMNFTTALLRKAHYTARHQVDEDVIDRGNVYLAMDQSDVIVSTYVYTQVIGALKKVLADFDSECHTVKHVKDIPLQINEPVHGTFSSTYGDFALPGLMAGTFLMFPLISTLSALMPEKVRGTLERSLVSGVTTFEIIISHFVTQSGTVFVQIFTVYISIFGFYEFYRVGDFGTLAILTTPIVINGMMIGFLVALLCTRYLTASVVPTSLYLLILVSSGATWPLEGVPKYVREIFWLLPITAPTNALRHVLHRGWTLSNTSVQIGLAVSLLYFLVFSSLLTMTYRLRRRFNP